MRLIWTKCFLYYIFFSYFNELCKWILLHIYIIHLYIYIYIHIYIYIYIYMYNIIINYDIRKAVFITNINYVCNECCCSKKMVLWANKGPSIAFPYLAHFWFFFIQCKYIFRILFVKLYGNMGVWFINSSFVKKHVLRCTASCI